MFNGPQLKGEADAAAGCVSVCLNSWKSSFNVELTFPFFAQSFFRSLSLFSCHFSCSFAS